MTQSHFLSNRLIVDLLLKENVVLANKRIVISEYTRTQMLGWVGKPGTCRVTGPPGERYMSSVAKHKTEVARDQNASDGAVCVTKARIPL